ncbi:hypothetical protein RHSIM_Rhsim02G0050000 [Rhododendron simsii]|uniref:Uncharacterized protein n=1 Tax=Rhododendron simsii TaxID=118357 RepID=A0A834HCK8_RHOSS|nr:hypothetical protein RHSIM_Rhsim02G0050000 [Rhododendron simsii]
MTRNRDADGCHAIFFNKGWLSKLPALVCLATVRMEPKKPLKSTYYGRRAGVSASDPQEDPILQQPTNDELGKGREQPLLSVQDLNESMGSVRNYMLETNHEIFYGVAQTNVNVVSTSVGDLVAMMKEERKAKGLTDLPPQTPVMPHFGVFNGFSRRPPHGSYSSPQPLGFQASSSSGGSAHASANHQSQDPTGQNPLRSVENLDRRFMMGGSPTPRPTFRNQNGRPPPMGGGHTPHMAPHMGFMQ